jgi:hypothetical protein
MSDYEWSNVIGEPLTKRRKTTHHVILPTSEERIKQASEHNYYPCLMGKEKDK